MGRKTGGANNALRALFEGAPVNFDLLARASGRSIRGVRAQAKREGWDATAAGGDPEVLERRLAVLSNRLVGELEEISAEGSRADGRYDKARIDALSAMLRMVEKIGETARVSERAAEKQNRTDEEMAAALRHINDRIIELARELAAQMVRAEHQEREGTGNSG